MKKLTRSKKKTPKKQLYVVAGVLLFIVILIVVTILCQHRSNNEVADLSAERVDYDQRITNEDGVDFDPVYDQGSESDFLIRFADLQCNEDCSNVGPVILNNMILTYGEDYEIQPGSIIIVLLNRLLKTLSVGKYNLITEVNQDGQMLTVGVHITIENSPVEVVCGGNQIMKNNECVDTESNPRAPVNTTTDPKDDVPNDENVNEPTIPTSQDEPEPVQMPEFNLNDNYYLHYFVERFVWKNPETDDFIENGQLNDNKAHGTCEVVLSMDENAPTIKKTYWTSDRSNITKAQVEEDKRSWEANGFYSYDGAGYLDLLTESYCNICGLDCGRW